MNYRKKSYPRSSKSGSYTKKATQQLNTKVFTFYRKDANGAIASPVNLAVDGRKGQKVSVLGSEYLTCVSFVTTGSDTNQCIGNQIIARSAYLQCDVSIPAIQVPPDTDIHGTGTALSSEWHTANLVRICLIQDKACNGVCPKYSDVFLMDHNPNIKNNSASTAAGDETTLSTSITLNPDKSRRFKILFNEVVSLSEATPFVHVEKYMKLNFPIMYQNNAGDPAMSQQITNTLFMGVFSNNDQTSTALANEMICNTAWTVKLRFEP